MNQPLSPVTVIICITLCLCAIVGVSVEGICIVYKIPDMNMPIGQSFTHVLDTIIGGLIGAFVGAKLAAHNETNVTAEPPSNINIQPEPKP